MPISQKPHRRGNVNIASDDASPASQSKTYTMLIQIHPLPSRQHSKMMPALGGLTSELSSCCIPRLCVPSLPAATIAPRTETSQVRRHERSGHSGQDPGNEQAEVGSDAPAKQEIRWYNSKYGTTQYGSCGEAGYPHKTPPAVQRKAAGSSRINHGEPQRISVPYHPDVPRAPCSEFPPRQPDAEPGSVVSPRWHTLRGRQKGNVPGYPNRRAHGLHQGGRQLSANLVVEGV